MSSCGGHLAEVRALRTIYGDYDHFYVVNDKLMLPEDMDGRTYFIAHAERDWRVLKNFWEAWRILRRTSPDLVLSTGAGPVVPFAVVARLLGIWVVFVETAAQVSSPSLTGRIMYRLAHRFYYQWPELRRAYPRGTYGGLLL